MFLLEKKHPIETDIIIDILKSEKIPYKLRAIRQESYFYPSKILGYNIEIYSDLEHFDYAQKLIEKRINDINKLNAIFYKPEDNDSTLTINNNEVKTFQVGKLEVSEYKPRKSILRHIIDWIRKKA